ncbi:putative structural tail fiber protein [Aeromonas phage Gekk3-15]
MSISDVSGFGLKCAILSTATFPYGFSISKFPDDVDPIVISELTVRKLQMLLDGKMLSYQTANPVEVAISVIPGSPDDINLGIILSASQVKDQLIPLPDTVIMTITYPDGSTSVLADGTMLSGPAAKSVMASGRMKTSTYKFAFGASATVGNGLLSSATSLFAAGANILG